MNKTVTFASIHDDGTLITSKDSQEALSEQVTAAPTVLVQIGGVVGRNPDPPAPAVDDFQPICPAPHTATLREALALTRKEFAARYHIPLATLRDWEHGLSEPDQPMRAYLTVIARHPTIVLRALQRRTRADRLRALASEDYWAEHYPRTPVKNSAGHD